MPGFGSMLGGRRVVGLIQAVLSVGGMGLTLFFGLRFIQWYLGNWQVISQGDDPVRTLMDMWHEVRWALLGIAAYALSLLWGLATGFAMVREAKRQEVAFPAGSSGAQ